MCHWLIEQLNRKKIDRKNAADIDIVDLTQTDAFLKKGFIGKILSKGLEANAKVYGYKVDNCYDMVYKVVGGLGRSDLETNAFNPKDEISEKVPTTYMLDLGDR